MAGFSNLANLQAGCLLGKDVFFLESEASLRLMQSGWGLSSYIDK
jgi:hypothetical protein